MSTVLNPLKSGGLTAAPPLGAASASQIIAPTLVPHTDKRADLLWGKSKMGKGINAWMGAHWMLTTHGKKFLYLTAEPSAMPKMIEDYIKAGLGDIFSVVNQDHLLAILSTVLEGGKWPVYMKKNDGSIVRSFNSVEAKCDPSQYGMLIVDSLTSLGDEIIKWFTIPGKATLPMTPGEDKFNVQDTVEGGSNVHLHGSSPMHVGEACRILQRMVISSANLPYDKVVWIAREQRGSRGEKKDKSGNVIIAGEPMYGPDLPGNAATPRVTSWFGGAYHCDAAPKGGVKDDRPVGGSAAGAGMLGGSSADRLSLIPNWEYRIYLRPHPDPITGLLYDAGNRLPAHLNANDKIVPPYLTCTVEDSGNGDFKCQGLNTIWEIERTHGDQMISAAKSKFASLLEKFQK